MLLGSAVVSLQLENHISDWLGCARNFQASLFSQGIVQIRLGSLAN